MLRRYRLSAFAALGMLVLGGCAAPSKFGRPGERLERRGDEIVIAGQFFHTGAPVVLWTDPGGYDAYRIERHFDPTTTRPTDPVSDSITRYGTFRRHLPEDVLKRVQSGGWDLPLLQEWVDLFVLHYDVCGTSRRCFKVLHDHRGLSVHFMLDVDGTIYQTLDVKERAWHAGPANDRSVGIEIANMGAYPPGDRKVLDKWYETDAAGQVQLKFPPEIGETGIRTPDFVGRPARNELVCGTIHGREVCQYDLTPEQYASLIRLTATLSKALPKIRNDYPRDAEGKLHMGELSPEEMARHSGLIGHWHITTNKIDPGPAFDWERLVQGVEALR